MNIKNAANVLAIVFALGCTSVARAATYCEIDNLPSNFKIALGGYSTDAGESMIATWANFATLAGVTNTCASAGGVKLVGTSLQIVIGTGNPHYKNFLDHLRYAKANGSNVKLQIQSDAAGFTSGIGTQFVYVEVK